MLTNWTQVHIGLGFETLYTCVVERAYNKPHTRSFYSAKLYFLKKCQLREFWLWFLPTLSHHVDLFYISPKCHDYDSSTSWIPGTGSDLSCHCIAFSYNQLKQRFQSFSLTKFQFRSMEEGFYIASPSPRLKLYVFVCLSVPLLAHTCKWITEPEGRE